MFGEGRDRPRTLLQGSPEHNMCLEAKVLRQEGGYSHGTNEAGKDSSDGAAGKEDGRPPDRGKRKERETGTRSRMGSKGVNENSTSGAKEKGWKGPRIRLFPRE